jgi:hypothetical protein
MSARLMTSATLLDLPAVLGSVVRHRTNYESMQKGREQAPLASNPLQHGMISAQEIPRALLSAEKRTY